MPKALDHAALRKRVSKAMVPGDAGLVERSRNLLLAYLDAAATQGQHPEGTVQALASGAAATAIGQIDLQAAAKPDTLACREGCAFCCILSGEDGGTITGFEAGRLHAALKDDVANETPWHPDACAALDAETRMCRAYDARPMICRTYISPDVSACETVAHGKQAEGPGVLGPQATYLAVHALARAALKGHAQVPTFALAKVTASAVTQQSLAQTLPSAQHPHRALEDERKRQSLAMGAAT